MKIANVLIVLLIMLSPTIYAQDKWEKLCDENPKMALAEAEKMYAEAQKEKNSPKLIQALILQIKCSNLIDSDALPDMLKKMEKLIAESSTTAERSLLHSLAADLYSCFHRQQMHTIGQRKALKEFIPEDINEWSSNLFIEKVFTHALAAIESKDTLQTISADDYRQILLPGKDSRLLRPTLYDFLCYRSLQQIEACRQMNISRFFPEQSESNPEALAPLDRFLTWSITPAPYAIEGHMLKIYQELLAFRNQEQNRGALLIADLERLDYARHLSDTDSVYLRRLGELRKEFHGTPYLVEVLYKEADYYTHMRPPRYEEALALCQEGIRDYPNYRRIGLLKEMAEEICEPVVNINYQQNIYPGKKQSLHITYRNTGEVSVVLSRVNETTPDYRLKNHKKETIRKEQVFARTYHLPQSLKEQDTTFMIPVATSGLYELTVSSKEIAGKTFSFIANTLFTTLLEINKELRLLVRDAVSGMPVKNAQIIRYQMTGFDRYTKIDSLKTGPDGMATFRIQPSNGNSIYYEVINRENPNNELAQLHGYGYWENNYLTRPLDEVNLYTDRRIYRPGQTVYYSGISWTDTPEKREVRTKEPYTVRFQDANGKQIGQQVVSSNDWGSFTGSFVIPDKTLNGQFALRVNDNYLPIDVVEYKRPAFEITFDPQTKAYAFGDEICVTGQVKSYSGLALTNSQVSYQITLNDVIRRRETNKSMQNGILTTNRDGRFEIRFPAEEQPGNWKVGWGHYYQIEAAVTDAKGETQEASTVIRISDQSYQLTIEMPKQVDRTKPIAIRIGASNSSGWKLAEQVSYAIYRLAPLTSITQSYITRDPLIRDTMITGTCQTNYDSITPDFSKWESGAYLFVAQGVGMKNNPIVEKQIFYLYSGKDKQPPLLTYKWIVEEKTYCKPGESAEILLGSSAKEVQVLYELYTNNRLVKRKQLQLSNEVVRLSIPYEEDYGDNVILTLSYVKDQQLFSEEIPIYKIKENKELTFKTTVFRDKLQPGEKETWEFSIMNAEGQPALAEVMAVMYDQSLDQLSPHQWRFSPFFERYGTAPRWNPIRPSFAGFINLNDRGRDKPKVDNFQFDALNFYGQLSCDRLYDLALYGSNGSMEITDAKDVTHPSSRGRMSVTEAKRHIEAETSIYSVSAPATGPAKKKTEPLRQNFQETAFFYPQLLTNENGVVTIRFTMPEATTRWKFMAIAHTKEMDYGQIEKTVTTAKELMVMPNIPRFFRNDDSVVLKTTVSNQSSSAQSGEATLELFTLPDEKVIFRQQRAFTAEAGQTATVDFNFRLHQPSGVLGCRISASSATFSDGEQHLVAVLPNRVMLTEAMPFYASKAGSHDFHMPGTSATKSDYRLTLELTTNPVWYAVLALPSLQEPQTQNVNNTIAAFYVNTVGAAIVRANPRIAAAIRQWNTQKDHSTTLISKLEQNSELKSILLEASPWVLDAQNETERMQSLAQLFDQNRLDYLQKEAMKKLHAAQNEDGGWSWFKGWHSDPFMTQQVLVTMVKAGLTGQKEYNEAEKIMQIKALRYLDENIQKDFEKELKKESSSNQLSYLYTRSLYRDIPLAGVLKAHKYYMAQVEASWTKFTPYEKARAATTLWRYGKTATAKRILASLKGYATIHPDKGMYWANQPDLTSHVAIMEAFYEIEGNTPDTDLMKQWLLCQKRTQIWENVPATVDAIYALLLTGSNQLDEKESLTVAVGKQAVDLAGADHTLGYVKTSWPASEITPDMKNVRLTKQTNTPTWGGLYLQYSDQLEQVTKTKGKALNIEKKLFTEQNTATGQELIPVGKEALRIGDKVIVRLTITLDRAMEYLHLQELPAACFEPVKQLSGNQWKFGTVYYEEVKDAATNFFFDRLERGTYVLEYPVWVNQAGEFQEGIATLQCLYAPEFISHTTAGERLKIH